MLPPFRFLVTDLIPSSPSSKSKSKWLDPCQEAASKSIKCLNRNGGDRAMCQDYFECVSHGAGLSGGLGGSWGLTLWMKRLTRVCLGRIGSARRTGYGKNTVHSWL